MRVGWVNQDERGNNTKGTLQINFVTSGKEMPFGLVKRG